MHRGLAFPFILFGCFLVFVGCFLPWTHSPTYNLFTIGDYSGSYGQYIDELRFVSLAIFSIPFAACLILISLAHERTSRIVAIILGLYCAVLSVIACVVIEISSEVANFRSAPGAFIAIAGGIMIAAAAFMSKDRSKMVKTTKETNG